MKVSKAVSNKPVHPAQSLILPLVAVTIFFCAANPALADETPRAGGPLPVSVDNMEVQPNGNLKKLGAKTLSVYFETPADNGFSTKAWLIGSSGEKIVWLKPVPLKLEVNRAKTDVVCRQGQLVIISQFPASAAYTSQTFNWNGQAVTLVKTKSGDPSQEMVDRLIKIAAAGTRAQLDNFENGDNSPQYPGNYITTENLLLLLDKGHKTAQALAKAGKPALAAERMELAFDASQDLVEMENGAVDKTTSPAKWLEAWNADCVQLPSAKWTPLLKDYAQYLQKCGKHNQAKSVLAAIADQATKEKAAQAATETPRNSTGENSPAPTKGSETAQAAGNGPKASQH